MKTGLAETISKQYINMVAESSGEFERAFRGAIQYALDTGFTEIQCTCTVVKTCSRRNLALLRQVGRCVCGAADWMQEIFNLPTFV